MGRMEWVGDVGSRILPSFEGIRQGLLWHAEDENFIQWIAGVVVTGGVMIFPILFVLTLLSVVGFGPFEGFREWMLTAETGMIPVTESGKIFPWINLVSLLLAFPIIIAGTQGVTWIHSTDGVVDNAETVFASNLGALFIWFTLDVGLEDLVVSATVTAMTVFALIYFAEFISSRR